ncbi:hypothetical protein CEXT_729061 [Caerostris extrusa]|uniref:Transmembrane protein n=1 Tax=Caerostris extrusa TaxID=172846 RepID=A0AAV4PIS3_CAEEX|nr:hypothetical protein CEXT_729061 [Caerostris extrusa]
MSIIVMKGYSRGGGLLRERMTCRSGTIKGNGRCSVLFGPNIRPLFLAARPDIASAGRDLSKQHTKKNSLVFIFAIAFGVAVITLGNVKKTQT